MTTSAIFGIAFALAMDAFAVSVAAGITLRSVGPRHTFRLAWHFGFFQFAMPLLGWAAGSTIRPLIERFDHWLAFLLLLCVGVHMIREAFQKHETASRQADPTRGMTLVVLSFATSIDALAVGLSLSILNMAIWFPAVIIGIVAALCTTAGIHIGSRIGSAVRIGTYADIAGGLVLIGIGVKILHDHGALSALL